MRAKKVAQEAEVFSVKSEETPVQFENNRLKHIQTKESGYIALRIFRKGKMGYAVRSGPANTDLVDIAVQTSEFGTHATFQFPASGSYPDIKVFDPKIESISTSEMVKLGEDLIASIRGYNREVICSAEINKGRASIKIMNSRGGKIEYKQSTFSLSVEGQLLRDTDMLFVGDGESSCHPINNTAAITSVVRRQLQWAKEQALLTNKEMPVIFTPGGVASALIPPLMSAFNGKVVLEKASPLSDKIGNTVFDRKFSLYDDPTLDYRPESRPADDEGVFSRRTILVEDGSVANFIYDLKTAALANKESTGNGTRNYGGVLNPMPTAFILAPGKTSFEEMVNDIREGLVIEYLMGAAQGNMLSGDFSGNVLLGYKIENGTIVGRVKNTMVSGNVYHLLKEIIAVGDDSKWEGSSINTPSYYFPSLPVAVKN